MTNFDQPPTGPGPDYTGGPQSFHPGQGNPGASAGAPGARADESAAIDAPEHRVAPAGFDTKGHVKRGRVSALWIGLIAAAVILILLIIFIAQNLKKASIHFLGLAGHLPVGLIVLIAAITGLLLAAVPGSIRILQLRKALKANTPKDQRTV